MMERVHCRRKRFCIVFWDRGGRREKRGGEIFPNRGGGVWRAVRNIVMTA